MSFENVYAAFSPPASGASTVKFAESIVSLMYRTNSGAANK